MKSYQFQFYKFLISSFASEERHHFQTLKVFIKKITWFVSNDKCTVLGRPGNKKIIFCLTAFCTMLKLKMKISTPGKFYEEKFFLQLEGFLFGFGFLNARSVKNTVYLSLKLQKCVS